LDQTAKPVILSFQVSTSGHNIHS